MASAPPDRELLDPQKLHWVNVDRVSTRYYEDGTGEAMVLLHGGHFGSYESLDIWGLNIEGLAQSFHVYAVDRLGMGHTDVPHNDTDYSHEGLFRHLVRWVETLGIKQAHFVGHSRGGLPATCFALEHAHLVKTLTIVDSNTTAPDHPAFPTGRFYQNLPDEPDPPTLESVRVEVVLQSCTDAHITQEYLSRRLEVATLPKNRGVKRRMEALGPRVWMPSLANKRREVIHRIDAEGLPVHTLVVWGVNDPSAPLPLGYALYERIAARTPRAEMHVLNGGGHYSFREQPQAFNRVVTSFCLG